MVLVRDRVWKVRAAEVLFQDLMRAKPQVAIDIDFVSVDRTNSKTWGIDLPTQFPLVSFGGIINGRPKNLLSAIPAGFTRFLTFEACASFMGLGLTDATLLPIGTPRTSTMLR